MVITAVANMAEEILLIPVVYAVVFLK